MSLATASVLARAPGTSCSEHLLARETQAGKARGLAYLEVAPHGIADACIEAIEVVRYTAPTRT